MSAGTATMLALPPAGRGRPAHLLSVTTLLVGVAELMAVSALVAAYLNVRALAAVWPPKDVSLDNYLGTVALITVGMSVITAEWAVYALRRGNRRQTLGALGLTVGLGAAFVNLIWYTGTQLHFGPADHSYAVLVYALLITVGAVAALGIGYLLVALVRTLGGQVTSGDPELVRGAAFHWHVVATAWLLAFMALYVLQHR
jgi:heme/copper-type cytochrome/quinol oxidase subunit 3